MSSVKLYEGKLLACAGVALILFLIVVCITAVSEPSLFTRKYGRSHRLLGMALLVALVIGAADAVAGPLINCAVFDLTLGVLGTATTLSAARDFRAAHSRERHRLKNQSVSGTLGEKATVTVDEMIEHSFYQLLNLAQIFYLHTVSSVSSDACFTLMYALIATLPWILRNRFPVNHFSDNWKQGGEDVVLVRVLYRVKKAQYLVYKHGLFHGLNFSVALDAASGGGGLSAKHHFRLYWICLNTSYVMEFFLQSLVKAKLLSQTMMIALQQLLMLASSITAVFVLSHVRLGLALLSCALNFCHRGHDFVNAALVATTAFVLYSNDTTAFFAHA